MPLVADEQTKDAVNLVNIKNLGEMHGLTAGLSGQNQLAQQQRVNEMANSVLANAMNSAQQMQQLAAQQALNMSANAANMATAMTARASRFMLDISAEEAVGFSKTIGADLATKLSEMSGQLASVQEMAKIANTTPPQTGTGGAFGSDSGSAFTQQIANLAAAVSAIQSMLAAHGIAKTTP